VKLYLADLYEFGVQDDRIKCKFFVPLPV